MLVNASMEIRTISIIVNSISPRKSIITQKFLPRFAEHFDVNVVETKSPLDAVALASGAVKNKTHLILAAGGDGTLHQVLNGILQHNEGNGQLPALGVIPLGSGNDFSRTLSAKADVDIILAKIKTHSIKMIDVGKATLASSTIDLSDGNNIRYFINEASVGLGPAVVSKLQSGKKWLPDEIRYYVATLASFFTYKPTRVEVVTPQWKWEDKVRSLAVANGKYYGHGLCIAPDALLDSGMFSVFIAGNVSAFDFIRYSDTMKQSKKVPLEEVLYKSASNIELKSKEKCLIEADGELIGWLPAKIEILPRKIAFLN